MMPNLDGYEACKRIRVNGDTHVPIIATTANVGDDEKIKVSGMSDILGKPFKVDDVLQLLKVHGVI